MLAFASLIFLAFGSSKALAYSGSPNYHKDAVNTTSGKIIGHAASNRSSVTEYLGIRYADAATGPLRFAPPVRYNCNGTYYASNYSADCPANISPVSKYPPLTPLGLHIVEQFTDQQNRTQSEDCLTLNIWTGSPHHRRSKLKAVLLFIPGGRFQIPGSHNPFYNGQYLAADEDIVIVTINYRVTIFGFLGAPGLTQNVGLLDQRSAIKWVRDNIAGFGGDPSKITIWGQSAGGMSVDLYSYSYALDPIVRGLISDSGVAWNLTPTYAGESTGYFFNVSGQLGCGNEASAAVACLRTKPFTDILAAAKLVKGTPALFQRLPLTPFRPIVDNKTVFADYISLAKAGEFAKLPYLVGNTNNEGGFYILAAYAANITLTPEEWAAWDAADFTCPSNFEATERAAHGVPVWRYRYFGDFPNLRLYPGSGAYHGTELDMVFGTAQDVSGVPNSPLEDATRREMMKAWATFAKDPAGGLRSLGWPTYDPGNATLVRLGYDNSSMPSFVEPSIYDTLCPPLSDPMPDYGAP